MESGPTRKATAPFDREDAEFIIRSPDNVDFYVFRAILMVASTVFEGMLPIPQPPAESSSRRSDTKPVVGISEDSHVMDTFLRVVYPLTTPQLTSLFHVREVLDAGIKYDASIVINEMRTALTKPCFLAEDPLQVFSIAYNCRFEEETRAAAVHAVAQGHLDNVDAHIPALASVTAGAYYRLMEFHRIHKHAQAGPKSTDDDHPHMPTTDDIGPFCREPLLPSQPRGGTIPSVLAPFTDSRANLVIKSHDGREFHVHRAILDVASPTLISTLLAEDCPAPSGDREGSGGPLTYRIPENSAVVDTVLRFCYPGPRPTPEPAAHFLAVLSTMQQYAFAAPTDDLVRAHWAAYASREPFRFFFHAVARRLPREARACAQLVACGAGSSELHTLYVPEMEGVGALAYHRLLAYVEAYRSAALQDVHGCTWTPPEPTPIDKPTPEPSGDVAVATRPCVDDGKCVCTGAGVLTKLSTKTLPSDLLEMLATKLHHEPHGGVLLNDHALVATLAGAAHNAMCVPEFHVYVRPPLLHWLLVALAIGLWCRSLLVACVVALTMWQFPVKCGCPKGKHIPWAEARLRDIARGVDEAVSQVSGFCWSTMLLVC